MVTDEIEIWRNRPVDEVYPIVYIDGLRIKVRDKGAVTIKVAHLAVGVDVDGRKHALGLWIAEVEGAKFWHSVLTQLRIPQMLVGAGCATSSSCAATA